ncbi:MAG: hypothetical protein IJ165_08620 [Proteobacteria bacterium]|nr:hypothetical protein [Pseudomonadota bacterium]
MKITRKIFVSGLVLASTFCFAGCDDAKSSSDLDLVCDAFYNHYLDEHTQIIKMLSSSQSSQLKETFHDECVKTATERPACSEEIVAYQKCLLIDHSMPLSGDEDAECAELYDEDSEEFQACSDKVHQELSECNGFANTLNKCYIEHAKEFEEYERKCIEAGRCDEYGDPREEWADTNHLLNEWGFEVDD